MNSHFSTAVRKTPGGSDKNPRGTRCHATTKMDWERETEQSQVINPAGLQVRAKLIGCEKNRASVPPFRSQEHFFFYCREVCEPPAVVPMSAPLTTSSTRRLSCLPWEVSLDATGSILPKPTAVTEPAATPCWTRNS